MTGQAECPAAIRTLVERYGFHRQMYLRGQYNETQLRRDFVDSFFKVLGWDVDNNKGYSEAYREVAHEHPIRIRGSTQHVDYAFRIGDKIKFVVETKKPAVRIKDDTDSALQLRRYAWNAGLALSILMNFEEFAVYDCTKKPTNSDDATTGRIEHFSYEEYPNRWEWIASLFTQESILKGSFDRFAESTKGKKGTAAVDDTILAEIEGWRDALARNIALRNPTLSVEELNTSVQRTIDRILFLRICEDRGIEQYETLKGLLDGDRVYERLTSLFRNADDRYNSGIFHFHDEKDRELPDTLSLSLQIDDKVLKDILRVLYFPDSPFEFSVIPPAILGHVYEQFLGKVIRLTEGHRAVVEEKPEVKKAGGVYYTPEYIVDYIVKHTVGELVKGKTPREISKIRILDPACGSGSFLLGAYQFLLDWHRDWYVHNLVPVIREKGSATAPEVLALLPDTIPAKKQGKGGPFPDLPIYQASNGEGTRVRSDWKLTTAERKRILLNNIYGVDIDTQAVEVTKLSLLLKVLEEESEETVSKQLTLFAERALPSLHLNIKCGNSLIGPDFFTQKQIFPYNFDEQKRINPFDWKSEFQDVMASGGFDVVVGNPPYVRQESLKGVKEYFQAHYKAYHGTADLYVYFIEKGISLLRPSGIFSYIVANKWLRANYGTALRRFLKERQIEEIIDFGDLPVFKQATTYPCILRVSNATPTHEFRVSKVETLACPNLEAYITEHHHMVDPNSLDEGGWSLMNRRTEDLLRKLKEKGTPLERYVMGQVYRGILTGLNRAFVIDEKTRERLIQEDPKSAEVIKPFLLGRDIKRYAPPDNKKQFLIFTRHGIDIKLYPSIFNHLKQFKDELMPKPEGWTGHEWKGRKPGSYEWYEIQDTIDYYEMFDKPKIIYLVFQVKPAFTFDNEKILTNNAIWIIPRNDLYLLGILNSKIGWFLISNYCTQIQNGYQLIYSYLGRIPIYLPDFSHPADTTRHDRMVALVSRMLDLHKRFQETTLEHEKALIQRQIGATDKEIDNLVYELYGLTEEERRIVE